MAHTSSSIPARSEYDFIIVGGGTAGLVVAARLSEDPRATVLVLEAGPSCLEDQRVKVPGLWGLLWGSELDWKFRTTPQHHLEGRIIRHPQGRVLGGSSAINNQAFIAPSQAGIDLWGQLNPGWDWTSLKPYYQRFYTLTLPDEQTRAHLGLDWADDVVHGASGSGPIQVSFPGVIQDPTAKAWVDSFKNLELDMVGDPFSGSTTGGYSNATTRDEKAERSYSASAYYAPIRNRPNLHLLCGALVERLHFGSSTEGGSVTAHGVSYILDNKAYAISAVKEVILAAGTLQTPKLLELSGIGDPEILSSHDIPVQIPNPSVGENLQDHLMTGISYEVQDGVMTGDGLVRQEPEIVQAAMQMYTQHKAGPLANGGAGSHAYIPNAQLSKDGHVTLADLLERHRPTAPRDREHYRHIESILNDPKEGYGAALMFLAQVNLHAGPEATNFISDPQPGNFLSLGISQSYSLSRGSVHVASSDVSDPPIIDPRYLSNPLDLELLARQLLFIESLSKTEPLATFLKPNGKRNHPSAFIDTSDLDAAMNYVTSTAISTHHPSGSCAMMPREKGGVVDPELVVYGTTNVRVVDASIMPFIPRGNIQSTVYAVAEKAADIVKRAHGLVA